jgi:Hemerythrin HHE cation binding domain
MYPFGAAGAFRASAAASSFRIARARGNRGAFGDGIVDALELASRASGRSATCQNRRGPAACVPQCDDGAAAAQSNHGGNQMLANQFAEAFRGEHRQLRDLLLGLIDAFQSNDVEAIQEGIHEMAAAAGPHFHYEGEALYPALSEIYGEDYVERLQAEHDRTLAAARELAALGEAEELPPEAVEYGLELIRQLLPHVSESDGLSVIVEVLPPAQVGSIMKARKHAKRAGISLHAVNGAMKRRRPARAAAKRAAKPKAKAARGRKRVGHAKPRAAKPRRKTGARKARAK